jgi:hypothetical protein
MGPAIVPIVWIIWHVIAFSGQCKKDEDDLLFFFLYHLTATCLMYWAGFFDELLRWLAP